MKNIVFETDGFIATTYIKGEVRPSGKGKAITARKGEAVRLDTADEVPLFFFAKDKVVGGFAINKEMALNLEAKKLVKTEMVSYSLLPNDLYIYLGPCLTFSHTNVSRDTLLRVINLGYGAAAKRTDGIDFLDVPLLVLLQMRELGIPMKNIYVSEFDTFENPNILYSELSGDKEKNVTEAKLI